MSIMQLLKKINQGFWMCMWTGEFSIYSYKTMAHIFISTSSDRYNIQIGQCQEKRDYWKHSLWLEALPYLCDAVPEVWLKSTHQIHCIVVMQSKRKCAFCCELQCHWTFEATVHRIRCIKLFYFRLLGSIVDN